MRCRFVKMEGAGNDYVYVDAIGAPFPLQRAPELARRWSDRHFGIGADGLIVMLRDERAPVRMAMWNADGSRGAMCGNGLRCLAKLARDHGHVAADTFDVATDAGLRRIALLDRSPGPVALVRAAMGEVRLQPPRVVAVLGQQCRGTPGDAGNPHFVVFVPDVEAADVAGIGAALQGHGEFPGGVNVEFVRVLAAQTLQQRTYERGSGETLACGTGAAVAAAAAWAAGLVAPGPVTVRLRGGDLRVVPDGPALAIEGPARTVFTGEIELDA